MLPPDQWQPAAAQAVQPPAAHPLKPCLHPHEATAWRAAQQAAQQQRTCIFSILAAHHHFALIQHHVHGAAPASQHRGEAGHQLGVCGCLGERLGGAAVAHHLFQQWRIRQAQHHIATNSACGGGRLCQR